MKHKIAIEIPPYYIDTLSPTTEVRLEHFIVTAVDLAASSSGLRGCRRTYCTILKLADHSLCKMVRHVLLRPLRTVLLAAKSTAVTIKCSRREVTSVVGLKEIDQFEGIEYATMYIKQCDCLKHCL
jgi:hypothetical protein